MSTRTRANRASQPSPAQSSGSSSPQSPPSLIDVEESSSMLENDAESQSNDSQSNDGSILDLTVTPMNSDVDTGRLTKVTDVRSTQSVTQSESSSKLTQLESLLNQTAVYSSFLAERMPNRYQQHTMKLFESSSDRRTKGSNNQSSDKSSNQSKASGLNDSGEASVSDERLQALNSLITGDRKLFMYQAVGVDWLISLFENGLNGILADEMGLGKTVQIVTFLAHLLKRNVRGPFLVVAPLSTLDSWMNEFASWCPQLSVMKYHSSVKEERKPMRDRISESIQNMSSKKSSKQAKQTSSSTPPVSIIVTSYDIAYNDASFMKKFNWKLMIVDEGHRLKNVDSKLLAALKEYPTENRILLTGTPLQNNLRELWSLMNFLLPTVFNDLKKFEKWFDFDSNPSSTMKEGEEARNYAAILEAEKSERLVSKLHAILHPFVLRRLKIDVLKDTMPSKREWLIYCPMTDRQRSFYEEIMSAKLRTLESGQGGLNMKNVFIQLQKVCDSGWMVASPPWMDSEKLKLSDFVVDDEEAIRLEDERVAAIEAEAEETGTSATVTARRRKRTAKAMNLPPPKKTRTFEIVQARDMSNVEIMKELVGMSAKMHVVDLVLQQIMSAKKGKVLIFSQYLFALDLLGELVAAGDYGLTTIRIDGSTPSADRTSQVKAFNSTAHGSPSIALLSTRAAGLGLNLQSASNVILFDSDWNPQMDLQAQDRAHRVGSKDDVVVMRLLTPGTIEMKRFRRAESKKMLTTVVMARNRFKGVDNAPAADAVDDEDEHVGEHDFLLELQRMLANDAVKGVKAHLADSQSNDVSSIDETSSSSSSSSKPNTRKQPAKVAVSVGVTSEEVKMLLTGKMNSSNVESHPLIELADEWLTDMNV